MHANIPSHTKRYTHLTLKLACTTLDRHKEDRLMHKRKMHSHAGRDVVAYDDGYDFNV